MKHRTPDRKSTRLNSSHRFISYAVFCLKKKTESVYLGVQDSLPEAFTAVADQFSVTATFSVFRRYTPLSLTASLPGCLSLALGIFLFPAKGVRDVLRLPGD